MSTSGELDVVSAERHIRDLAERTTAVNDGECLYCYLTRMVQAFGCAGGGRRWTEHWIASQRRGHKWVLAWARSNGGICCDCEVMLNAFLGRPRTDRHRRLQCEASYEAMQRESEALAAEECGDFDDE
jgi:hypothetical protein